jgi:hypothetical protein
VRVEQDQVSVLLEPSSPGSDGCAYPPDSIAEFYGPRLGNRGKPQEDAARIPLSNVAMTVSASRAAWSGSSLAATNSTALQ